MKKLWLPATTTKVTVQDGKVTVWDEIEMSLQPIKKDTGFKPESPPADPSWRSP